MAWLHDVHKRLLALSFNSPSSRRSNPVPYHRSIAAFDLTLIHASYHPHTVLTSNECRPPSICSPAARSRYPCPRKRSARPSRSSLVMVRSRFLPFRFSLFAFSFFHNSLNLARACTVLDVALAKPAKGIVIGLQRYRKMSEDGCAFAFDPVAYG